MINLSDRKKFEEEIGKELMESSIHYLDIIENIEQI